jgi:hypothetical protein
MLLQLDPPIPMLTPKGPGLAHILIDYGPEFDLHWTIFLDVSGECWTYANRDVRASKNISLGRTNVTAPRPISMENGAARSTDRLASLDAKQHQTPHST